MHRSVFKSLFAPLLLLVMSLGFALPASAADTWKPQYIAGHHVYLDPALQSGANPVNLDGLESAYQAEAAKHGIEIFYIMTLKGDEQSVPDFAGRRLDDILGNWSGQPGFPASNAVLCYVVRLNTNWTKSAVACNVASELAAKGVSTTGVMDIAKHFSQHNTPNPDALLPQNPKGFALTVAQNTNLIFEQYAAGQIAAQQQAEQAQKDAIDAAAAAHRHALIAEIGVPLAALAILLIVLFLRKRKHFAAAVKVIADWDALFQAANTNYLELESHYLDFLKRQGENWKDKFKGATLIRYTAAITAFADLSARIKTSGKLLASAKNANDKLNIFSVSGNILSVKLLTENEVTINSKALSFEEQGLFGALLDSKPKTEKPHELLADMDALFRQTNTTMADIMAAFEGSIENKKSIEALFAEVETLKANLLAADLNFTAYQSVYDRLVGDKDAFLAISDSDPLQAFELSKTVNSACTMLKAKIGKAIELRKNLSSTDKAIADATSALSSARAQSADYNYPDGGAPAAGAAATYLFNETGSNPDDALAAAKSKLNEAIVYVGLGRLDESTAAKTAAEAHAAEVSSLIKMVLGAKEAVQKQVPVVHGILDKLSAEIPAGEQALAALTAGFLAANFSSAPGQVSHAKAVQTSTTSQLAAVKQAFFEQRFVAAAELVKSVTGDIQGSRDGIIAVQTRLQELGQLRAHAKSQTATNAQSQAALARKLATFSFTTSAQTDAQAAALTPTLSNQQNDVSREITDWPAAAQAADHLAEQLHAIDGDIDSEKAAHDHAETVLQSLRDTVSGAVLEATTDANVVRSAAKSAVGQAQQVLAQAEASIKVAKSDWNGLTRYYEGNIASAQAAHQAATDDKNAYNAAALAITNANNNIRAVENGSYSTNATIGGTYSGIYGNGVSADCSQAWAMLQQASQLLSSQRYEDAEREAGAAHNAANAAAARAEAIVQAQVDAALLLWQAEVAAAAAEAARLQAIADAEAARLQAIADAQAAEQRRIQQAADDAAAAQRAADYAAQQQQQQNDTNTQSTDWGSSSSSDTNTQSTDFS